MTYNDAPEKGAVEWDLDAKQAQHRSALLQWWFGEDRKLCELCMARIEEIDREAQQSAQWTDIETDGRHGIMQELQAQRFQLLQQWASEEAAGNQYFDDARLASKALSLQVPQLATPLSESQPQAKTPPSHGKQNPTERLSKSAQPPVEVSSSAETIDRLGEHAGPPELWSTQSNSLVARPKSRHGAKPDSTAIFDEIPKVVSGDEHQAEAVRDGFDIPGKTAPGLCLGDKGTTTLLGMNRGRAKRKRNSYTLKSRHKKERIPNVTSTGQPGCKSRTCPAEDGNAHVAAESVGLQDGAKTSQLLITNTPFAADLEYDGYTSQDSYSGDPTSSTEWRLFQVKQVSNATSRSVTQYWGWADKTTSFNHMVLAETVPKVRWGFLKDVNFHLRLFEMNNIIYAADSNVIIIETGIKNRGDILVEFKRDRTKRRFLTFIHHKGIKLQKTAW